VQAPHTGNSESGKDDCGWHITSQPGQRIQLVLAAFGGEGSVSSTPAETDAQVQAVIDAGHSSACHNVRQL